VGVEANFVVLRVVLKHRAARRSFLRIRSRAFTEIPRCIAIRMLHDKMQLLNVTVKAALFDAEIFAVGSHDLALVCIGEVA